MASETPRGFPTPYGAESIDTFLEVLQRRRSIRTGFLKDKPVSDELIEKILEAARWAPSAGNSQPWEFLVIRDLEIREKIVEIFKTQMRDKIEIEEATRGQRRRVNAGVDFRHAGPCTRGSARRFTRSVCGSRVAGRRRERGQGTARKTGRNR